MRRSITVPGVYVGLVVVTVLSPLLLTAAVLVDLVRRLVRDKPAMGVRMLLFLWAYLLGEAWGLLVLAFTSLADPARSMDMAFRLQYRWVAWNFRAVRLFFDLSFSTEGEDEILPGPIILISRHASMIDTLLPSWYVSRPGRLHLRYVLKKELLIDPALDLAGNKLPNHFLDRGADASDVEIEAIRALAADLDFDDAVLIYPEGTRFSEEKRQRYLQRFADRSDRVALLARELERVLPPRPGGTLALLEGCDADVLVLAHRGLEGFARLKDIWSGGLVGSEVSVRFHRVPRSDIPQDRSDRIAWLYQLWSEIDDWLGSQGSGSGRA